MGIGSQTYAATLGESQALREHFAAMIPIQEQQATSELEIRKLVFEQELKQAEQMNLLSQKLSRGDTQPVFITQAAPLEAPETNYLPMIVIGILAVLYFKKGKLL